MIDLTVEPRFASAFVNLMQAYAAGGHRIAQASADQGFKLWTRAWCPAQWQEWSRSPLTPWGVWAAAIGAETSTAAKTEAPASNAETFASYRTSSGYATAQVIVLEDRRR